MAREHQLCVIRAGRAERVSFTGAPLLSEILLENGFPVRRPCGGRGVCRKCALRAEGGIDGLPDDAGRVLACQARLRGNATVWLPEAEEAAGGNATAASDRQEDAPEGRGTGIGGPEGATAAAPGEECFGFAADVGTTTLALRLHSLQTGRVLAEETRENPQTGVAADVMGRIQAALEGRGALLAHLVSDALEGLLTAACAGAGVPREQVRRGVIAGNTTMLYLLTGRDPASLAAAPYAADCLFDSEIPWHGAQVLLPRCVSAFFGADALCAVLRSGMCDSGETALLCDVGTNGEMALWHEGRLWTASVAAGPVFEGAGIRCGCTGIPGAIDRVWPFGGGLQAHTIGDAAPVGLCGSGLLDAVAAALDLGEVDAEGTMEAECWPVAGGVALYPEDIRAVQLAKAAMAAGLQTLMESAGVTAETVKKCFLAGSFGSALNLRSAARIGLIPGRLVACTETMGNGALAGASRLLTEPGQRESLRRIAAAAVPVALGGNDRFAAHYLRAMRFA